MTLLILVIVAFLIFSAIHPDISARDILRFLISTSISLIVMALILGILAGLGQGITIMVSLFWDPINMLVAILCINFLALILSHFPDYFEVALRDHEGSVKWVKTPAKSVFGLVYYTGDTYDAKSKIYLSFFRREIGVLTYVIWINILLTVYDKTYEDINVTAWSIVLCSVLIILHYILETIEKSLKVSVELGHENNGIKIKRILWAYLIFFGLNLSLVIVFIWMICLNNMTDSNLILFVIITFVNAVVYILFRVFRGWFAYFNNTDQGDQEGGERKVRLATSVHSIIPFERLVHHPTYLTLMTITGVFLTLLMLFLTFKSYHSINALNPICVFIIVIIIYYSTIVIILKHYFYHQRKFKETCKRVHKWWSLLLSMAPFLIIGFLIAGTFVDNDLHTLIATDENDAMVIDSEKFVSNLKIDSTLKSHFVIGAYGGGLKANVWTMMVLQELKRTIGDDFLASTLCMSGVSGGAMGLGSYTMLSDYYVDSSEAKWHQMIDDIGNINALSSDISGWLIKDLIRDPLPISFGGKDRAYESMMNYAKVIGDDRGFDESFRHYWKQVYEKNGHAYPAIIINTTPTQSRYGVACSVAGMDEFPIMIDILGRPDNKSIAYLSTVSTSNRFPLFSPAAQITGKGHFVDGGYFENSGLLNATSFYDQLKQIDSFKDKKRDKVYAINIINDKANYILANEDIRKLMMNAAISEKGSGEFAAILNGIVALERMPNYVRELIQKNRPDVELIKIEMPYDFTLKDIEAAYKTTGLDEEMFDDIITTNRESIQSALDLYEPYKKEWGIIPPPLGRLLSPPAVQYQHAMIENHKELKDKFEIIKSKLYE